MIYDKTSENVEPMDGRDTAQVDRRGTYAVNGSPPHAVGSLELFVGPIQRWRSLAKVAVVAAVLSGVLSFVLPSRYTVSTSFIADDEGETSLPAGLAGLASQIGLDAGLGGSTSPQFYADLVRSRSIIRALLHTAVPADGRPVPVIDLLGISDDNPIRRVEKAEKEMVDRLHVSLDRATERIDVEVWMRRPETAKAVADSILALVDRFDRDIRQTHAGQKRAFAEEQRKLAADSLHIVEDSMAKFLTGNREYQQSAQLQFEHDRLQRVIALRQELYLALAREAAESRIDEVDSRPMLTIINPPVLPGKQAWPRPKLFVLGGTLVAVCLAWLFLVLRQVGTIIMMNSDSDARRAIDLVRGVLPNRKERSEIKSHLA